MARLDDLIASFVDSRLAVDTSTESHVSGLRREGNTLIEHDHPVAGWDNPGEGADVRLWIDLQWRGAEREKIERELKALNMMPLPIVPTESIEGPGASVLWWEYPVECLACMEPLEGNDRLAGFCTDCRSLRRAWGSPGGGTQPAIEQRRGLNGEIMPHTAEG